MAHRSSWLASCIGALTLSTGVIAQEYPTKPVTIVVSVNSPADFAMQIKTESARLQKIISAAGLRANGKSPTSFK